MEFKGKVIMLLKDRYGCIHLQKKKSKGTNSLETYTEYLASISESDYFKLIKSYVINSESSNYVWSSSVWRTNLNKEVSAYHQKYLKFLEDNRKDIMFIGPYKSKKTKGLHLCSRGHEWMVKPLDVTNGATCPKCKGKNTESKKAKFITDLLENNNIEFIKEVSLKRFGYENELRLDFVICNNNFPLFAIEFNGVQHYRTIRNKFFGGRDGAKQRRIRDRKKRRFCWEIGLPVIDIPYDESEEQIEDTVSYFLHLFELVIREEKLYD